MTVDEYKDFAEKKAVILAINKQINELKKKKPTELTAEEFELLNNQNDYLRQKYTPASSASMRRVSLSLPPE